MKRSVLTQLKSALRIRNQQGSKEFSGINPFHQGNGKAFELSMWGVKNYFSTAYGQHQDGLAESGVKSKLNLAQSGMAESDLAEKYWFSRFSAANCANDCRNATYKARIKNTPWGAVYGEKKDVSKIQTETFRRRAWMHLNKERCERPAPRAVEVVNLDFASDLNTSLSRLPGRSSLPIRWSLRRISSRSEKRRS